MYRKDEIQITPFNFFLVNDPNTTINIQSSFLAFLIPSKVEQSSSSFNESFFLRMANHLNESRWYSDSFLGNASGILGSLSIGYIDFRWDWTSSGWTGWPDFSWLMQKEIKVVLREKKRFVLDVKSVNRSRYMWNMGDNSETNAMHTELKYPLYSWSLESSTCKDLAFLEFSVPRI